MFFKRTAAVFLSIMMLTCTLFSSFPVLAEDNAADSVATNEDLNEGSTIDEITISDQEVYNTLLDVLDTKFDPKSLALLATKKILGQGFGISKPDKTDQVLSKLDDVLKGTQAIQDDLHSLTDLGIEQKYVSSIETVITSAKDSSYIDYYKTLNDYDNRIEAGNDQQKENIMQDRFVYLTVTMTGITDQNETGALSEYSKNVNQYCDRFFNVPKVVTSPGESATQSTNLLQAHTSLMHYSTHWENQAYQTRLSFQVEALTQFETLITLDRLSCAARIERINTLNETNGTHIQTTLLETHLKSLDDYYTRCKEAAAANKVTSPATDNSRHYWYKSSDYTFAANAVEQKVPSFSFNQGTDYFAGTLALRGTFKNSSGQIVELTGNDFLWSTVYMDPDMTDRDNILKTYGVYPESAWFHFQARNIVYSPNMSEWNSFVHYDTGNNISNPDYAVFKQIRDDYYGTKSLYDIFFSESEGNLTPPAGMKELPQMWRFVINADGSDNPYRMYYDENIFCADHIDAYVTNGNADKPESVDLVYYKTAKTTPYEKAQRYIGIGLIK